MSTIDVDNGRWTAMFKAAGKKLLSTLQAAGIVNVDVDIDRRQR
jgi:hypothetical protein